MLTTIFILVLAICIICLGVSCHKFDTYGKEINVNMLPVLVIAGLCAKYLINLIN